MLFRILPYGLATALLLACGPGEGSQERSKTNDADETVSVARSKTENTKVLPGDQWYRSDPRIEELIERGFAATLRGDVDSALVLLDAARDRALHARDTLSAVGACLHLASAYGAIGADDIARPLLLRALRERAACSSEEPPTLGECYSRLALAYYDHEMDSCALFSSVADSLMRDAPFTPAQRYYTLQVSGLLQWRDGDHGRALATFERVRDLLKVRDDGLDADMRRDMLLARIESNLCNVLGDLMDNDRAVLHGQAAVALFKSVLDSSNGAQRTVVIRSMGRAMQGLSGALMEQMELDSALDYLQWSISLLNTTESKDSFTLQAAYFNTVNNRMLDKDYGVAMAYLDTLNEMLGPDSNRGIRFKATVLPIYYYTQLGLVDSVKACSDRSLEVLGLPSWRDSLGLPDPYAFGSLSNAIDAFDMRVGSIGDASFVKTDLSGLLEAAAGYDRTLDLIHERVITADMALRPQYGRQNWDTFRGALRTNSRIYAMTSDPKRAERMIQIMEASRNLRDIGTSASSADGFAVTIRTELDSIVRIEEAISSLRTEIASGQAAEGARAELDLALSKLSAMHEKLREHDPELHEHLYSRPRITLAQIRQELRPGTAVVEYFTSTDNLYAVWLDSDTILVQYIALDTTGLSDTLALYFQGDELDGSALEQCGEMLVHQLLEGAMRILEPKELLIIPDGQLCRLPFEALPFPGSGSDTELLMDKVRIRYESSMASMLSRKKREHESQGLVAAFAPVNFGTSSPDEMVQGLMKVDLRSTLRSNGFGDLVHSQAEVDAITSQFEGEGLTSDDADETRVRQAMPVGDVLHFATHAFADLENPEFSGLVLSGALEDTVAGAAPNTVTDNVLYAHELRTMDLHADLVVLSACESGAGTYTRGDGVQSLARAFRSAGVPNIVSSLWKVDDLATKQIMVKFYEFLAEGMGKADALAEAKRWYRKEYPNEPPSKWAAFILIGDNEPVHLKKRSPVQPWLIGGALAAVIAAIAARRRRLRRAA